MEEKQSNHRTTESHLQSMDYYKAQLFGHLANQCIAGSDYLCAIKFFDDALELCSFDYRFFVNRSFCYDRTGRYKEALEDAEKASHIEPNYGKCHFRLGKALKGLKRWKEAEQAFLKVIELEGPDCQEAREELESVWESIGTPENHDQLFCQKSPVECGGMKSLDEFSEVSESESQIESQAESQSEFQSEVSEQVRVKEVEDVSEKEESSEVSESSEESSEKLSETSEPIEKQQPKPSVEKENNNSFQHSRHLPCPPKSEKNDVFRRLNATCKTIACNNLVCPKECYFWRTTGCTYPNTCPDLHIPGHRAIDFKPWMAKDNRKHRNDRNDRNDRNERSQDNNSRSNSNRYRNEQRYNHSHNHNHNHNHNSNYNGHRQRRKTVNNY